MTALPSSSSVRAEPGASLGWPRRPWGRLTATAVALAVLVGGAGCTADDADSGPSVSAEIGEPAVVESSTTAADDGAAADPTTTTAAAAVTVGAADPEQAAVTLYAAWQAGDRNAAATVAEPAAVDGIFTAAPGEYRPYNRCNTGEFGQSSCLYRGDPGTIQFNMKERDGAWVVTVAIFSPA
jgi:hypothetical protein